jgi:hypothetical protein
MGLSDKYKHLNLADKYRHLDQSKKIEPMAQEIPETQEPGYLESGLRGVEQGLTFGFGDELNAALEALTSAKSYQQAVEESRQKFKEAEEANPWTSAGGTLVGSLIPAGLVSKGVGAGARALQAIAGAGEAIPLASKLASPASKLAGLVAEGAAGEGGLASMAAAGTAEGGVFGGLTGAGSAENVEQIPERIKEEAKTGALLGGAGGALFGTGKYAKDKIMDTDIGQDIARSWKLGTEKGINYLSKIQKDLFQEQLPENVEKSVISNLDTSWKGENEAKNKALESFEGTFSVNPDKIKAVEADLPETVSNLSNPENIKKLEGDLAGTQETLSKVQQELDAHPLSDSLGLKSDQKSKPVLVKDIKEYTKASQAKEASVRKVKVLNEEAQQRVNELRAINADLVARGQGGGTLSSELIRDLNEKTAQEIGLHPLLNDADLVEYYRQFKTLGTKAQEEFLLENPQFAEHVTNLEGLIDRKNLYSKLEKLSSDKGNTAKVIRESEAAIKRMEKYLTVETERASISSASKLSKAEEVLKKSLSDHGVELTPEQLESLKNDTGLLRNIDLRKKLEDERLLISKKLSTEQNNITKEINLKNFAHESDLDTKKGIYLSKELEKLKQKFGDLQNIPPEKAQELFKEIRTIEKNLSSSGYIGDISKDAPRTVENFNKLKRAITEGLSGEAKYITPTDEFGNLLPTQKVSPPISDYGEVATSTKFGEHAKKEKKIADILELLTGERKSYAGSPSERAEMIKNALKSGEEKFGIGERFNYREAMKLAQEIGDPKLIEGLENLKYQNELAKGYGAGSHRYMHNKMSELFTKGVTSAAAAETAGARKFVGNVASKVPTPGDLFKPEVAQKLSERSPTLGKMLSRISDANTTEAKKRAYQNILMNNPVVRKMLTESSGE